MIEGKNQINIEETLNKILQKKEALEKELHNIEVQLAMDTQNLEKYEEYLLSNFGTTDIEELSNILEQKKQELYKKLEEVNQIIS